MKLSGRVKSVSYLKAHAAEVIRDVTESRQAMVITQRGEARVVVQDARSYDALMESLAMLKLLAISRGSLDAGRGVPLDEAEARIRAATKGSAPG